MRVGEVARRAGVSVKTLHYYERIGIIEPSTREPNGYRSYPIDVLDRLAFTRAAQALGLSLREIRDIIELRQTGDAPCSHVLTLLDQHVSTLAERMTELAALRDELEAIAKRGRTLDPADCAPNSVCHVIVPTSQ